MAQHSFTGPSDGQRPQRPADPSAPPAVVITPPHHQDPPSSFWQHRFAQDILPFLTSLALHLGLILAAVVTVHAIKVVITAPTTQPTDIELNLDPSLRPSNTAFVQQSKLGANMGLDTSPFAVQNRIENNKHGIALVPGMGDEPELPRGEIDAKQALGIPQTIGIGTHQPLIGVSSLGVPWGSDKAGGRLAIHGRINRLPPTGKPWGDPNVTDIFDDPPGNPVRSVVFVCDASGSMLNNFDSLRIELQKAVNGLRAVQMFNVVLFQDRSFQAIDRGQLMPATPANQRKAADFLGGVSARGSTDPIPALELALRQKPELVYLLTDGDFADNDAVLAFIRQRAKGCRINTIAFINRGEQYERVLQTIAKETGGTFKYVGEEHLSGK